MKISVGSDHAGFKLKEYIIGELKEIGYDIIDCGTYTGESVDYPDFAHDACVKIQEEKADMGLVICSTGIGISIAANKMSGIRAALCQTEFSAKMARLHNNANVLAIGSGVVGKLQAREVAVTFFATPFSNENRHSRRIEKISILEQSQKS